MRIAVVGTGGVGSYCAGALIEAGEEVHLLSTPRHVGPVRESGLRVVTDEGERVLRPASITEDPAQIGVVDVVVVATKLYQLEAALPALDHLVGEDTVVVTLQNGVSAPGMVAGRVGADHVVPGLVVIVAWVEAPGRIRQTGPTPVLTVSAHTAGAHATSPDARCAALVDAATRSGWLRARLSDDIDRALWKKFALITTMGGVNCLANATLGEVREFAPTRELMVRSLAEVRALANSRGVTFDEGDLADVLHQLDSIAASSTSSMQRDLREGRVSELPWLNGTVVSLAREAGVDVPFHSIATAVLSLFAHRGHV